MQNGGIFCQKQANFEQVDFDQLLTSRKRKHNPSPSPVPWKNVTPVSILILCSIFIQKPDISSKVLHIRKSYLIVGLLNKYYREILYFKSGK